MYIYDFQCISLTDDDSDGRLDEDCEGNSNDNRNNNNHAHNRAVGHEFMMMFMQNEGSVVQGQPTPPNELFVTSADSSSLTVRIQSPGMLCLYVICSFQF